MGAGGGMDRVRVVVGVRGFLCADSFDVLRVGAPDNEVFSKSSKEEHNGL